MGEGFEVVAGGLARHAEVVHDEFDLGVRMPEQVIEQVLAIQFGVIGSDAVFILLHELPDLAGQFDILPGGFCYTCQYVHDPILPGALFTDCL